ncbi:MAG: amidohydrolase [Blautia sp.]|nr:amidohydrolase [Blautia sp.]
MNYHISGGKLLVFQEKEQLFSIEESDLYIKDKRISFVPFDTAETYETVDAEGMLVMPGLVNMHTHAYMTIVRNYADDVPFGEWLFNRVMPVEDRLPVEAAYWANQLAFLEMIGTGTTSYVDMHMYRCQSAKAARDAGMRGFIGRGLVGEDLYQDGERRFREALDEKEEFACDTLQFLLSPHAIYSASPKLYQQVAEECRKRGMLKQTHLSESVTEVQNCLSQHGKTPVQLLYDCGFLDEGTILAHCVQMQGNDLELIKMSGAAVVTNPASNAKLGNGFAPVLQMHEKGIDLCIGTDGTSSNNTLNMFREMGLLSLLHKGICGDCTALPAQYVVKMATVNAAKALGREGELGVIREGALADLVFLDLHAPSLFPNNNIVSSLCYSANGSEVSSVMINGRFVMRKGEFLTIDQERVFHEVQKVAEKYL